MQQIMFLSFQSTQIEYVYDNKSKVENKNSMKKVMA